MLATAQNSSGSGEQPGFGQRGGGQATFGDFSFDRPTTQFDQYFYTDRIGMQLKTAKSQYALEDFINTVDYKLGPHDVLSIEVEGSVPMMARAVVVDPQGYIVLPMSGKIKVGGLNIPQAQDTVHAAMEEEVNDADVNLSVEQARDFTIHIHGEVPYPGKYTVPAGVRLDYAIYPALYEEHNTAKDTTVMGQPNTSYTPNIASSNTSDMFSRMYRYNNEFLNNSAYSLRNIIIKHKDGTKQRVDLLSYFMAGDKKGNPFVRNGDEIYLKKIKESDPRVSVSGAVASSQEFEYSPNDSLKQLIDMAGGRILKADTTKFYVVNYNNLSMNRDTIYYADLDSGNMALEPNERVIIPYQYTENKNKSAWVSGEVVSPGNYPINVNEDGTTAYDLLKLASGVTRQALTNGAYLIRKRDQTRGVPSSNFLNTNKLKRTSDQLKEGLRYLEVEERETPSNQVYVDLENEKKLKNIYVTDGDSLVVPKDYNNVILYGQVNQPGYYEFNSSNDYKDYLMMAGGKSIAADNDRIFVIKAGSRAWHKPDETEIESGDIIYVDRVPFDEYQAKRQYEIEMERLRRNNLQLILSAVSTVTAVLTTYVAITR